MHMYCVFCRSGSEEKVAKHMGRLAGGAGLTSLVPYRILNERCGGRWREVRKTVFPGYVFIYCEIPPDRRVLSSITNYYKMLTYGDGSGELVGGDAEIALWLHEHDGDITVSDVEFIGKSIRIVSGPLKDVSGMIEKVDRRKRRVYVRTEFAGRSILLTMGINELEMTE